MIKERSK